MEFRIEKKINKSLGRAGVLTTPHGDILTPAFVPVGTKASVKALKTPGQYKVSLKISDGWVPPAADETAASTTVVLNIAGECFEGAATDLR